LANLTDIENVNALLDHPTCENLIGRHRRVNLLMLVGRLAETTVGRWLVDCCCRGTVETADKTDAKESYEIWATQNQAVETWGEICKMLNRIGGINTKKVREEGGKRIPFIEGISTT